MPQPAGRITANQGLQCTEVIALDFINPAEFVASIEPMLKAQDPAALLELLNSRWSCEQITHLVSRGSCDVRKVAALALALVGGRCCLNELAEQLKHPDPMVNQMVEHALWSIWFRCGTTEANHELCCGSRSMNLREYDHAASRFSRAIDLDPTFAEAYNQRAIAKYLQERYDESVQDCIFAIERMPCHFGAWAGMGHCHAHEGKFAKALECYQKALSINPHLAAIKQGICELNKQLR